LQAHCMQLCAANSRFQLQQRTQQQQQQ
jgi:hypothetical protein